MVFLRCRHSSDFTSGNTEFKEMSFSLNFRRARILRRLFGCIPSALYLVLSCCLVAKLCLTRCNLRDCSIPGPPVLHYLPEFAQTHVHWDNDAIQPSHPLLSPSPPALNLSQHLGLFQWIGFLHQVPKVLKLQFRHQSFQWIFRVDFF